MSILSPKERTYQIQYILNHNPSLPTEALLQPLLESVCEAQDLKNKAEYEQKVKEIFEEIEKNCRAYEETPGYVTMKFYRLWWQRFKDRKEGEDAV